MLEANRENAAKSTGPRTKAGKERSRLNALVHGLSASVGLLPGEDRQTFRRLADKVYAEFRPRGQGEVALVDQYVSILWKLRRLGATEQAVNKARFDHDVTEWILDTEGQDWGRRNQDMLDLDEEERAAVNGPLPPVPVRPAGAAQLAEELQAGAGPLLRLMELEGRLRASLGSTVKQIKDLRALRKAQLELEREEEESGEGDGPWEPGEWDEDARLKEPQREDFEGVVIGGGGGGDGAPKRGAGKERTAAKGQAAKSAAAAESAVREPARPAAAEVPAAPDAPAAGPPREPVAAAEASVAQNEPDVAAAGAAGAQVIEHLADTAASDGATDGENVALCAPGQPDPVVDPVAPPIAPAGADEDGSPPV